MRRLATVFPRVPPGLSRSTCVGYKASRGSAPAESRLRQGTRTGGMRLARPPPRYPGRTSGAIAQMNPTSTCPMAVHTTVVFLPRRDSVRYRNRVHARPHLLQDGELAHSGPRRSAGAKKPPGLAWLVCSIFNSRPNLQLPRSHLTRLSERLFQAFRVAPTGH